MNEVKIFSHNMFGNLGILIKEGKEFFPATDVAKVLGYSNPHKAIKDHCKPEGVNETLVPTNSGVQTKKFINEPNLYRLIVKSKLPQAEQFETWVFEEVLPSIRKHGAYMTDQVLEQAVTNPDFAIGLLTKLKEEKEKLAAAQQQIVQQQPLVTFAEACMQSDKSLKVSEVAKLAAKHGVKTGQKRLFATLREWGLIFKNKNEPTQRAIDSGYFEVVQGVKEKPNGENFTWLTPYVTPKGQAYIIDRLKKEQEQEAV
ncbi:TPA: phage antirepressor Ant [Bacillus cereus]|uniref:Phage antirepressor KilAC domain protein n=1 Tax=Bacillus cereus 03BB108 TaxID=451709 RepID=A0AAN0W4D4_BACCE|nr:MULTISPECIES: phage antirepressor Ant [Bacillus cereus group]AEW58635.1 Phage antirepressor protein [Bacillus cereus F837/76]AJH66331.1 phage antirepressor KilAC domain protein [Bacillus thuringiensis]AJI08679.1 phage antirepressor KilAC domain protein [Bacillus cereus 03BB108]QKH04552.1 phage antirepressor Ant [Bacillus cereus]QKH33380.1 phage antirepressor Ant [Bacillus thuringiensis]